MADIKRKPSRKQLRLSTINSIKSRSISLRVKRKKDLNNLNVQSKVKEAYVIAVEDEAQKRLEKLSLLHKIEPVDMTKLASENSPNASFDSESCAELNQVNQTTISVQTHTQNDDNSGIELTDFNQLEMEATKKPRVEKRKKNASNANSDTESPVIESVANVHQSPELVDKFVNESFSDSMQDSFDQDDSTMHREMAIDCPENFIGTVKIPPKLPPSYQNSTESLPIAPPTTPSKSLHQNDNNTDSTLKSASVIMSNGRQNHALNQDQLDRLHKHQEELRKRREEETRLAREDEFLRASLRGSKKLQALEKRKQLEPQGFVNTAFDSVDDFDNLDDGFSSVHGPLEKERYMKKNIGLEDLFSTMQHIKTQLNESEDKSQISVLQHLFNNDQFRKAVQVHNKIIQVTSRSMVYSPEGSNALQTSNEVMTVLQHTPSPYASDLVDLISMPGFQNLLRAHDGVADHHSKPSNLGDEDFNEYPISNFGDETVKIIHLEKTNEPLGATVRNEGDAVVIGRIVKGGTAEKSGLLHEGDEILEVNGIDMKGKNINDVSEMLGNMTGTITFMIIPSVDFKPKISSDDVINVKALFNYDPEEDIYIPCRELGISFMKGDILRVMNREDLNWWQAYREGDEDYHELAGLIPSSAFLDQREAYKRTLNNDGKDNTKKGKSCSCGKKEKRKKKKQMYKDGLEETEEVLTYEEVSLYYPQPNRKRPIVLIGPGHVGRHELRQRLMESDFDRFAAAIPHTSRPRKETEVTDGDYHFVSAAEFKFDIENNKFIEHGEFEKNLYGTSLNSVRQIINQGKICVLNLHPESLRMLKESDLKPYIVFVYPPNMEKLRQIQQHLTNSIKVKDEELQESIERAREMEDKYGHYFDYILVNSDMEHAYEELLNEINRLEVEPQWVPTQWVGGHLTLVPVQQP